MYNQCSHLLWENSAFSEFVNTSIVQMFCYFNFCYESLLITVYLVFYFFMCIVFYNAIVVILINISGCLYLDVYIWTFIYGLLNLDVYIWTFTSGRLHLDVYIWTFISGCLQVIELLHRYMK